MRLHLIRPEERVTFSTEQLRLEREQRLVGEMFRQEVADAAHRAKYEGAVRADPGVRWLMGLALFAVVGAVGFIAFVAWLVER